MLFLTLTQRYFPAEEKKTLTEFSNGMFLILYELLLCATAAVREQMQLKAIGLVFIHKKRSA